MGYARAAFAAGVAVGFIAGARAGREQYDQIVKYGRKVATSPQVQQACHVISAKVTELTKSAAAKAPKASGDVARKARDRVAKINVPKMPKASAKPGRQDSRSTGGAANPDAPPVATQPSVNGDRNAASYKD